MCHGPVTTRLPSRRGRPTTLLSLTLQTSLVCPNSTVQYSSCVLFFWQRFVFTGCFSFKTRRSRLFSWQEHRLRPLVNREVWSRLSVRNELNTANHISQNGQKWSCDGALWVEQIHFEAFSDRETCFFRKLGKFWV